MFTLLPNRLVGSALLISFSVLTSSLAHAAPPVTNLEYDANGNNTKIADPSLNRSTTQQYDAIDRLIQQNQPHATTPNTQQGSITTQYNAIDEVTGVTDPRSLSTSYTKNAYGDVLSLVSPDTGTTTNTYDNAGNLKTRTDAVGKIATYTYDATNRPTRVTYRLGTVTDETINWTYDQGANGIGRLTGMTNLSGSTAWNYDQQGHVINKQQRNGNLIFDVRYLYDTNGRMTGMAYPSSRDVDYLYNANGQIEHLFVNGIAMLSNIQYHATGSVKSWVWANGQSYQRSIDSDGRTASYTVGDKLQTILYDNAGRITQSYRALPATPTTPLIYTTSTYSYDNVDRLTNHQIDTANPTNSTGYQYDLSGNRTRLNFGANLYPYTIAPTSNRLTAEAGPTPRTFTYDAAGNITGDGVDTYSYYNSGRLKQVTRGTTNIYALRYNGLGQFVHRTNGNVYYVYDEAGHLLGEYASNGNPNQETIWLGDIPVLTFRTSTQERIADNNSTATTARATVTGTWATATTIKGYFGSNYRSHVVAASTTDNVTYTITPTATQSFNVYARWVAQATNASNATYTIAPNTAGSTPLVVTVNQRQDGGTWNYLGTVNLNTANQMTVTLSGQGNGIVMADAVKIVPNTTSATQASAFNIYTDHLNTPREIRNHANQLRWTWYPEVSGAFGAGLPNENPNTPALGVFAYNLRFPGQLYDPTSQLSYNYYRDYSSRTGRYIESDPIGLEGGINTYGYVGGNPLSRTDPLGLVAPAAIAACMANPVCAALAAATVAATAKACKDTYETVSEYLKNHPEVIFNESEGGNNNPYDGPVDEPVIVVDGDGNAIPVDTGESLNTSPNGDYQQVIGPNGEPTGVRLDRGGHRNHRDPRARDPHGHRPGVTTPDGNPHLPINRP